MNVKLRLEELGRSLGEFAAGDKVPWEVGQVFNALLAQVKESHGDDPVVKAIEPAKPGPNNVYIKNASAGAIRALTLQLALVTSSH